MKTYVTLAYRGCKATLMMLTILMLGFQSKAQVPVNDLCSSPTVLTSGLTCTATPGTLTGALVSAPAVPTTCGTAGADVWYSFVAQSVYPTITLSGTGTSLGTTNARIQLFSGACGSLVSLGCVTGNILNTASVYTTGLTVGTTYLIRVYANSTVNTGATWGYSICVTDPPVNDLCANATPLTSALACNTVAGTLNNAAVSIPTIATTCGTSGADVWYSFVAQTAYPNVTLSGTGASLGTTNARIQLFSGTCGSLTALGCVSGNVFSTAAAYPTGLTVGTTYYIRVYSNTVAPAGATWDFSICVTDPPANDLCANAVVLTSSSVCNPVSGTLNNAAVSIPAVSTLCGTAGGDVWYSFVAQSVYPTITLSSLGASMAGANARIQLLSGTCGSLAALGCASTSTLYTAVAYPTGLTIGTTYYIRVYSNTTVPTGGSTWDFAICVTDPPVNDLCSNPTVLTSSTTCNYITGTTNYASFTTGTTAGCAVGVKFDVWFSFVAQTANPTITLNNIEANLSALNPRIQVFSGTCAALTSIGCSSTTSYTAPLGLTVGATYLVRVYSTSGAAGPATLGNFDICIQDPLPPANDDCSGAILLTSSTTCNSITSSVVNATPSTGVPAACAGTAKYDVWFSFVAQTTNPAIKLSTIGTTFNGQSPKIQVFSGNCGSLTSVGCGGTPSYTPTGLTVGATYYLRVYSITTSAVPGTQGNFDICIQDPLPPVNDNCATATVLTSAASCSSTIGTLLNSTPTAGIPNDCGDPASPEVWYTFVANSAYPTITLGSVGAQFAAAGPRIQILSGTCGSFTSVACVSGTSFNAFLPTNGAGLTIGNTYYVRIYTATGGMAGANWNYTICITDPASPTVDYGKSYVNITKGSGGGTIEPGDELEMRATIAVRSNMAFNPSFTGSIPANTTYVPGTLRILTNEGQVYKQWTDAADGDPATITGSTVLFNLGVGATQTMGGVMKNTDRPVGGGGTIIIVSYHVIVNAVSFGSLVSVGGGTLSYANGAGVVNTINFPAVTAVVYKNYGICTNTVGSNGILSEYAGTFGSGTAKDRTISGNVPSNYTYTPFTTGMPGDYYYGISNNTSPSTAAANYSITPNDPILAHHVFNVWDIIGDHTGAIDPLAGNPPADVNNGQSGGYMVVINASYRTDTAFLDTVKNLCPNTSYEYSAWFRNMCRKCSIDSTGAGPSSGTYVPTGPGDTSGVHPNLTFNINGYDYYTTGDMGYTGSWVKKGFTYRTGPTETQMIINIRNNAPGGGGNDWAIDDIGVSTCSPTLNLNPSTPNVNVCYGDGASLSADVISFFDNYTYYVWEKSTDNGVTFIPTSFSSNGTITPTLTGTDYVYTATGPSFVGDSTTNLNIFRLRVATTAANISDTNCSFLAVRTVQVYVNNCMYLLKTELLNANASLQNGLSIVNWQTTNESGKIYFEIEKSADGINFHSIGKMNATAGTGNGTYRFTDPTALDGSAYYRIKLVGETGYKYSKLMLLTTGQLHFSVENLVNPFSSSINCNVILPGSGDVRATVFDLYGRAVKTVKMTGEKGVNPIKIQDIGTLSGGNYFLKVEWQNESIIRKIIKANL